MRGHGFFTVTNTLAHHECTHQTGDRRVDVHHRTAGKVQRAHLPEVTGFGVHRVHHIGTGVGVRAHPEPDHVRNRDVAESEPEHTEEQNGREFHTLGKRAHDQRAGNRSKAGLEGGKNDFRDVDTFAECGRVGESARRVVPNAFHEQAIQTAEKGVPLRKSEAVSIDKPQHRNQREGDHHLHQNGQHVLAAHQAAVKQGQAGDRHHDHEQGGKHHPGRVALVGDGCSSSRGCGFGGCRSGSGGGISRRRCRGCRCGRSVLRKRWRQGRECEQPHGHRKSQKQFFHGVSFDFLIGRGRALTRLRCRFRRCGCAPPAPGRTQKSCRRRSFRCGQRPQWLRSRGPAGCCPPLPRS